MRLYKFGNDVNVSVARGVRSWDDWEFAVEGYYHADGEQQIGRVHMTRREALRMRRQLNALLKATAPPRRAR